MSKTNWNRLVFFVLGALFGSQVWGFVRRAVGR